MTLNQLETLTEDELAMALYIVNVIAPSELPKMEFEPRHLTWWRHEFLVKKIVDSYRRVLPECHATYIALLEKLGYKFEIPKEEPPPQAPQAPEAPTTASAAETTGSL